MEYKFFLLSFCLFLQQKKSCKNNKKLQFLSFLQDAIKSFSTCRDYFSNYITTTTFFHNSWQVHLHLSLYRWKEGRALFAS